LTAAVGSPGRKRKLDLLELEAKLLPLLGPAHGSVTNIRQQLAQQHQVQLSDTTLRRYLTRLGYRPRQAKSDEAPFQNSKSYSGTNVILSWPSDSAGFILQSTTNLSSSGWTTNSASHVIVKGQNTVTNPISGTQQFFRLSQ
jgi:hypothetical protein